MKRIEAIRQVIASLPSNDYAVFTTGMISREAFSVNDRSQNFYMIGSMGMAASFGLGLALNTNKRIVVFDGDGSALMEMGNIALIGSLRPANFLHIVLDNATYQSTGGQATISQHVPLEKVAKDCGYREVFKISTTGQLRQKLNTILNKKGPVFVLLKVDKHSEEEISRIKHTPLQIRQRFTRSLCT